MQPTMLTVHLTYFNNGGKFKGRGHFRVAHRSLSAIKHYVEYMASSDALPGLARVDRNQYDINILVSVPGHDHNHPMLVFSPVIKDALVQKLLASIDSSET